MAETTFHIAFLLKRLTVFAHHCVALYVIKDLWNHKHVHSPLFAT